MSKLFEFFQNHETNQCLPVDFEIVTKITTKGFHFYNNSYFIKVIQRTLINVPFDSRIILFYIPKCHNTFMICNNIIQNIETHISRAYDVEITSNTFGEFSSGSHKDLDINKVIFYSESNLSKNEIDDLGRIANNKGIIIVFRSTEFMQKKIELQSPIAFISHDSQNKDLIARPLAQGLHSRLCYVWYDEFSLKVGDSLRYEIEKGLKEAKKCILILTPEFIKNPGWVKTEFDSIFTREIILNENIILPIWFNVSRIEVYNFCPSLADKFALIWPDPSKMSESDYKNQIEILISKIHLAINS